jgi:hypothetical protein
MGADNNGDGIRCAWERNVKNTSSSGDGAHYDQKIARRND